MAKFHCEYDHLYYILPLSCALLLFLLFSARSNFPIDFTTTSRCSGRYIYIHNIPTKFNIDLLQNCTNLNKYSNMCPALQNSGLGPSLNISASFYATNQFTLGLIFHHRMKQYECLTNNSSIASAIYVPFYLGLEVGRHLWGYNITRRNSAGIELLNWLKTKPEWKVMGGKDHFLVAGRVSWDFVWRADDESDWGSQFLVLPESKNMTVLTIEASPWLSNNFAIPYPTYFHPFNDKEIIEWQYKVSGLNRSYLFSFAGAPRPNSFRNIIIDQCRDSEKCKLLECDLGPSKCESPSGVMEIFESSVFCLQPPGDSKTRRSTFDSMLAGCIPVFFHPGSAYTQYIWHLPRNFSQYSVLISRDDVRDGKVKIGDVLSKYSEDEVKGMREKVIRMIPRIVYADPRSKLGIVKDAFDVAVDAVIDRIQKRRKEMEQGIVVPAFNEANSWKYNLFGSEDKHEWDHYFIPGT